VETKGTTKNASGLSRSSALPFSGRRGEEERRRRVEEVVGLWVVEDLGTGVPRVGNMARFRRSSDDAGSAVSLCYSWRRSGFVLVSLGWVLYIAHFQRQWFGANENTTLHGRPRNYDPGSLEDCPDNERFRLSDELNCVSRCRPSKSQEIANFDPEETIKIVMEVRSRSRSRSRSNTNHIANLRSTFIG